MKVLTLVTVILLPCDRARRDHGHELPGRLFDLVWIFWVVIAAMFGIAVLVLSVARSQLDLVASTLELCFGQVYLSPDVEQLRSR